MSTFSKTSGTLFLLGMLAAPLSASVSAQELPAATAEGDDAITVYGSLPADLSGLPEGPEIEGFISSRTGRQLQVTGADGSNTMVVVADSTEIRARGGFLGLDRAELTADSLLNGLPVTVQTVRWEDGLVASRIRFKNSDLETAAMIRGATDQRFSANEAAIDENTAATEANAAAAAANAAAAEALRGRVANIDQYNVKGTTNVYFNTGRWNLSPEAQRNLCDAAREAEEMDNALLLVVGYTDSVGSQEYNQVLSERRAGSVVNFLQQQCHWAPYRMLTPTGMAEADPTADNSTAAGRAQNRRVSVNILVSKALDEM